MSQVVIPGYGVCARAKCGNPIPPQKRGRRRKYCSENCRKRDFSERSSPGIRPPGDSEDEYLAEWEPEERPLEHLADETTRQGPTSGPTPNEILECADRCEAYGEYSCPVREFLRAFGVE